MRVSKHFNLNRTQPTIDFVDIDILEDTPVFVDPYALRRLPSPWAAECVTLIQHFFETVLEHIRTEKHGKAKGLLEVLSEPNETHLGFSKGRSQGRGMGRLSANKLWEALKESDAIKTGLLQDLEDTILMIEGISSDIISDITTNLIKLPLIQYTQTFSDFYGIKLTENVNSGPIWDPINREWISKFVNLPTTPHGKLLFVPKTIVRKKLEYDVDEYYKNYILEELRNREINDNSSLIKLLKDGRKRVTMKDLKEKYGFGKSLIVQETLNNPEILERYRKAKRASYSTLLSHEDMAISEDGDSPDWDSFLEQVKEIPFGRDGATKYENAIEALITALFYPALSFPKKQREIHDERKRIDIEYTNSAQSGLFRWISTHYTAPFVFVECKNYSSDISNPEIDQISGRFSPSRGKLGIIICREFENKQRFLERCRDTAKDDRGFIIVLDDEDLTTLINHRKNAEPWKRLDFPLLKERFDYLVS